MAQLVFDSSVEGLVKAVGHRLSPGAIGQLASAGLDVAKPLKPAYPACEWARHVQIVTADLFPESEPQEGLRRVAALTVDAFAEGLIGSAMFGLVTLLGPDHTIVRMTRNFRTGCNFVETRHTRVAQGRYEIWLNDVSGVPGFYLGLLDTGMRHVGVAGLHSQILATDGPACTYGVEWSAR